MLNNNLKSNRRREGHKNLHKATERHEKQELSAEPVRVSPDCAHNRQYFRYYNRSEFHFSKHGKLEIDLALQEKLKTHMKPFANRPNFVLKA